MALNFGGAVNGLMQGAQRIGRSRLGRNVGNMAQGAWQGVQNGGLLRGGGQIGTVGGGYAGGPAGGIAGPMGQDTSGFGGTTDFLGGSGMGMGQASAYAAGRAPAPNMTIGSVPAGGGFINWLRNVLGL